MKRNNKVVCSVMAIIALVTGGVYQTETASSAPVGVVEVGGEVVGELIISPQALELIGNAENCRLKPYVCPAGLATDGIGNTHNVTGKPKTEEQIAKDWVRNIQSSEKCLVTSMGDASMSQGQIDAFTSFIFNTGCTRFRKNPDGSETRIFKHIRQGNYKNACNELRFWVYGAGKKLPGLVKRRQKEMELCFAN